MIIRQFRDADAKTVSDLIITCLKEINSKYYPQDVIEKIIEQHSPKKIRERAQNQLVLVADQYDEIVGTATINFDSNYFGSVFVQPKYQGKGIGKQLMDNLERLVAKKGTKVVKIHASINAVEFYEKLGYERIRLVNDEIFGKSYKMTKDISNLTCD